MLKVILWVAVLTSLVNLNNCLKRFNYKFNLLLSNLTVTISLPNYDFERKLEHLIVFRFQILYFWNISYKLSELLNFNKITYYTHTQYRLGLRPRIPPPPPKTRTVTSTIQLCLHKTYNCSYKDGLTKVYD